MTDDTLNLASLISSRICHDLISPIGAVTNGLELLEISGTPKSPELDLVADSALNVNARIRLFRLAFGAASPDQRVGSEEVQAILESIYKDDRLSVTWAVEGAHSRPLVRCALLALLCGEKAVPFGGQIIVSASEDTWTITATSERLTIDSDLWALLESSGDTSDVPPAAVQFLALPKSLESQERNITMQITDTKAEIRF